MTLNTWGASGRADMLANGKSKFWTSNTVSGEMVCLTPASDGRFADKAQAQRVGHQTPDSDGASISPSGQTGIASWLLGTRDSNLTLSAGDIAAIYNAVNSFGTTGTLAAPVVTSLASQVTTVRLDTTAGNPPPPRGNGQSIAQLAIIQGGNVVLLSQQNCVDLAPQLSTIGAT